ncbi:MAG: tetratricopeptide repeat protein [Prolixibacteraceae bacterium]|nr:tetratricopeptide repeat protein [Prolixibacteraceae bacterium]
MRFIFFAIFFAVSINTITSQNLQQEIQTNSRLANTYFNGKDYEKAAPLLLEVYSLSKNMHYFTLYIISMTELGRFEEAEMQIRREMDKHGKTNSRLHVHLGYVHKSQNKNSEAENVFKEVLEMIPANKGSYILTANSFIQFREFEWAGRVYLKGRKVMPEELFHYELARVYMYLRDYDKMMEEYLDLISKDEKQLSRVESSLSTSMRLDMDEELFERYRGQVLKRLQSHPDVIGYNRLLIWFFLQEKQFSAALRQAIALDRRLGSEDNMIFQMGNMAMNSRLYPEAGKAYEYLLSKGKDNPLYNEAYIQNIHVSYLDFVNSDQKSPDSAGDLNSKFITGLEILGYSDTTLKIVKEYGHFLAFYLDNTDKAISVLQKGLEIPRLKAVEAGELKTAMADIYLYSGDPWEAVLLYSQVIDANKNNSLGDEVKLKKARLGYYMGNFSWAKAQLDVLKASTSKLTANDAMELSMLIGNNLNLDTTEIPLQMFARADLLFFRNRDSLALATLDSVSENYPYHSLVDDILYRKAKIEADRHNYELAAGYLEQIVKDFSYEMLADDALFMLAEIYNYNLDQREKAKGLYMDMLTRFPGSVFVDESREKFRELRKEFPDDNEIPGEEFIIEENLPDELY